jgi:hypothetical protein
MLNPVRWLCPTRTSVLSHRNLIVRKKEEGRTKSSYSPAGCWAAAGIQRFDVHVHVHAVRIPFQDLPIQ